MRARRDEDPAERRLAQDRAVRRAVEAAAAGEDEVVEAGLLVQPADELHQRVLPDLLPGGGQVGARLEARGVTGPPEGLAVGEDLEPLLGDEDLVTADVERREPHRRRVAERCEAHDLALVALALRPEHLRQQRVEAAEAGGAVPVAVPELLGEALDPAAAFTAVERADLEEVGVGALRQRRGVGEVPDGAALVVDDEAGGDVERRRVEGAVEVGDVVRHLDDACGWRQLQGLAQLRVVLLEAVELGVGRPALDDQVDGAVQEGHPILVQLRQVAEPPPVVLAPADALLLQAVDRRAAAGHGDRPVLRAVDADDGGARHEGLLGTDPGLVRSSAGSNRTISARTRARIRMIPAGPGTPRTRQPR